MANCEFCGGEIEKGEDFVLVGQLPGYWSKSEARLFKPVGPMGPEDFGTIYHKRCYLKVVKDEVAEQDEAVKQNGAVKQDEAAKQDNGYSWQFGR